MNIILFPGNYPAIQVSSAPFPPVSFAVSVPGSKLDVRCSGPGRFTEAYGRYRKVSEGIGRYQKASEGGSVMSETSFSADPCANLSENSLPAHCPRSAGSDRRKSPASDLRGCPE